MLPEKAVVPVQAQVVAVLEQIPHLIVQKVRRLSHPDAMVEISCAWLGLDSSPEGASKALRAGWSDEAFGEAKTAHFVHQEEDSVHLFFAAEYPEQRYLTGRVTAVLM
jgi:hypothetical protein